MPEISRFYGLFIFMNYNDHNPPHFHAWYGDFKITVTINEGVVNGQMPQRALKMIFDWMAIHRDELLQDWENAKNKIPLNKIEPLN
ncbi:MAG: DUF4160 domain-containing protein [Bacteroidetes bacterium]|nr:MAG: DUF4160 domain-containing protein [Bacteroidota bacterium]